MTIILASILLAILALALLVASLTIAYESGFGEYAASRTQHMHRLSFLGGVIALGLSFLAGALL